MTASQPSPSFRLAYAAGVIPAKWVRIWNERIPTPLELLGPVPDPAGMLREGEADAGFVRLPVDRDVLGAIPLYTETTVVVVPKDHLVTAADEVTTADLADEVVLHPLDDVLGWERPPGEPAFERPATTADAVELVAAGIGLLVVPQSLARLHHRRDLTYRPVTDAPESGVALAWPEEAKTDMVEDFIGIVRGRTVNSTRGRPRTGPEPEKPQRGRTGAGTPRGGKAAAGRAGGRGGRTGGRNSGGGSGRSGNRRGRPRR